MVLTYTGYFMFSVSTQPTSGCTSPSYFSVSAATVPDSESRNRMYSMLLLAMSTGRTVNVGYDNTGGFCDNGYLGVYGSTSAHNMLRSLPAIRRWLSASRDRPPVSSPRSAEQVRES